MSIGSESAERPVGAAGDESTDSPLRAPDADRWLAEHGDALWRFCLLRARSRDIAEEIFQETLLAALKHARSFQGRASERTWLLAIASHKVSDHFRRKARDRRALGRGTESVSRESHPTFKENGCWASIPDAWHDPADKGETAAQLAALRACLDKLGPGMSEAVWLRDILGVPSEEVCEALDITPTNLWTRLHRARAALRSCVQAAMSRGRARPGAGSESENQR